MKQNLLINKKLQTKYFLLPLLASFLLMPVYSMESGILGKRRSSFTDINLDEQTQIEIALLESKPKRQKIKHDSTNKIADLAKKENFPTIKKIFQDVKEILHRSLRFAYTKLFSVEDKDSTFGRDSKKAQSPRVFETFLDNGELFMSFKEIPTSGTGNHCFYNALTKDGENREILEPITRGYANQEEVKALDNEPFNKLIREIVTKDIKNNLKEQIVLQGAQGSTTVEALLKEAIKEYYEPEADRFIDKNLGEDVDLDIRDAARTHFIEDKAKNIDDYLEKYNENNLLTDVRFAVILNSIYQDLPNITVFCCNAQNNTAQPIPLKIKKDVNSYDVFIGIRGNHYSRLEPKD